MGNAGSLEEAFERLEGAEAETKDVRQLLMDEMRAVRAEMRHLRKLLQHHGTALDYLVRAMKEDEMPDE